MSDQGSFEFPDRLALGQAHERAVIRALRKRGWKAYPMGQGQLPEDARDMLRQVQTDLRFMPDIYALKMRLALIDAKSGDTYLRTGNHAIQIEALEANERAWAKMGDCFFVFDDGRVFTPADVRRVGRPGRYSDRGSGTPFLLVPRDAGRPFDAVFGCSFPDLRPELS
jgi:hypothetical protein